MPPSPSEDHPHAHGNCAHDHGSDHVHNASAHPFVMAPGAANQAQQPHVQQSNAHAACDHDHDHQHQHQHQHQHGHLHNHSHGGHSHSHGLGHGHHHAPASFGKAFAIGVVLNAAFVVVEWLFGVAAHSLALMADAAHNLGDVLALLMAWGAYLLSKRQPSERFTYGLRGSSILAAVANAAALLVITGGLAWEAVLRLSDPVAVGGTTVIVVALAGVLVNGFTAWLFMAGSKTDLNMRGAYLHMAADAAISLGVAVAGALVMATGWVRLDPMVTLLVAALVVWSSWALLRDALQLALQAVPTGIDAAAVRAYLQALPGVQEVHDLHIWAMSTSENAMTVHLVMPGGHPGDAFLHATCAQMQQFQIAHTTVQVELADAGLPCALAPNHVV